MVARKDKSSAALTGCATTRSDGTEQPAPPDPDLRGRLEEVRELLRAVPPHDRDREHWRGAPREAANARCEAMRSTAGQIDALIGPVIDELSETVLSAAGTLRRLRPADRRHGDELDLGDEWPEVAWVYFCGLICRDCKQAALGEIELVLEQLDRALAADADAAAHELATDRELDDARRWLLIAADLGDEDGWFKTGQVLKTSSDWTVDDRKAAWFGRAIRVLVQLRLLENNNKRKSASRFRLTRLGRTTVQKLQPGQADLTARQDG